MDYQKTCNRCNKTKPLHGFSIHKLGVHRRHPTCKDCRNLEAKRYRWRKKVGGKIK